MDIKKIRRKGRSQRRTEVITIRVTPQIKQWLKRKGFSPTALFYEALREIGWNKYKK